MSAWSRALCILLQGRCFLFGLPRPEIGEEFVERSLMEEIPWSAAWIYHPAET